MPACTLMLNKIRCYLILNMDFVVDCLHQYENLLKGHVSNFKSMPLIPENYCYLYENLLKNREEKYTTCAIFCDLSKAFDTIDHSILLHKLEHFMELEAYP